jgi:hypothetical protein
MNPRGIKPETRKITVAKRPATPDGKTVYDGRAPVHLVGIDSATV